MKKLIFIFSSLLLLTISSCKKEEIRPNTTDGQIENQMDTRINQRMDNKRDQPDSFNDSMFSKNKTWYGEVNDSIYTITDPNRDEDDERKNKRK